MLQVVHIGCWGLAFTLLWTQPLSSLQNGCAFWKIMTQTVVKITRRLCQPNCLRWCPLRTGNTAGRFQLHRHWFKDAVSIFVWQLVFVICLSRSLVPAIHVHMYAHLRILKIWQVYFAWYIAMYAYWLLWLVIHK